MLVPSTHNRNFFDDFMMSPFDAFFNVPSGTGKPMPGLMKTDVEESNDNFQLSIDLPGVKKEDVVVEMKDGYLNVSAESKVENEEKDESSSYLRKERFEGKCNRSFYVGEDIEPDSIKAKFSNGVLKITVPKKSEPEIEEKKTIAIED